MFYRIPKDVFVDSGEDTVTPSQFDSVVLHNGTQWAYLHTNPSPDVRARIEKLGGELIAMTWGELKDAITATQADRIFIMTVRRTEDIDGVATVVERGIKRYEKLETDEVLRDWITPHQFQGVSVPGVSFDDPEEG